MVWWLVLLVGLTGSTVLKQINPPGKIADHLLDVAAVKGVYCAVNQAGQTLRSNDNGNTWKPSFIQNFEPGQPIFGSTGKAFYLITGQLKPFSAASNKTLWVSTDCVHWSAASVGPLIQPHAAGVGMLDGKEVVIIAELVPKDVRHSYYQSIAIVGNLELTQFTKMVFNGTGNSPLTPASFGYNPARKEWLLTPFQPSSFSEDGYLGHFLATKDFKHYRNVSHGFNTTADVHRFAGATKDWVFMLRQTEDELYHQHTYLYRADAKHSQYKWNLVHTWSGNGLSNPPYIRGLIGGSVLSLPLPFADENAGESPLIALNVHVVGDTCASEYTSPLQDWQARGAHLLTEMALDAGSAGSYYTRQAVPGLCSKSDVWRSLDGGQSWHMAADNVALVGANHINGRFIGVGFLGSVKQSTNGATWAPVVTERGFTLYAQDAYSNLHNGQYEQLVVGFGDGDTWFHTAGPGSSWKSVSAIAQFPATPSRQMALVGVTNSHGLYSMLVPGNPLFYASTLYKSKSGSLLGPWKAVKPKAQLPLQGFGSNGTHLVATQNIVQPGGPPTITGTQSLITSNGFHTYLNVSSSCTQNAKLVYSHGAKTWISYLNGQMVEYGPYDGYCLSRDGAHWTLKASAQPGRGEPAINFAFLASVGANFVGVNYIQTNPSLTGCKMWKNYGKS